MELQEAKQEYFEELKREADFKNEHPAEDEATDKPEAPKKKKGPMELPKEWEELTPA